MTDKTEKLLAEFDQLGQERMWPRRKGCRQPCGNGKTHVQRDPVNTLQPCSRDPEQAGTP